MPLITAPSAHVQRLMVDATAGGVWTQVFTRKGTRFGLSFRLA